MSFDVPKLVRSLGYDRGHNEESQNCRDIKIDILDGYIRTPEVFRMISKKTGVREGYRTPPPGGFNGPRWALVEKRRGGQGRPRAPSPSSPNWTRRGGGGAAPPFLPPLSFPSFPTHTPTRKRGSPTPGGSRTPPWRALLLPAASSP